MADSALTDDFARRESEQRYDSKRLCPRKTGLFVWPLCSGFWW
jgi:hypothetical protein